MKSNTVQSLVYAFVGICHCVERGERLDTTHPHRGQLYRNVVCGDDAPLLHWKLNAEVYVFNMFHDCPAAKQPMVAKWKEAGYEL